MGIRGTLGIHLPLFTLFDFGAPARILDPALFFPQDPIYVRLVRVLAGGRGPFHPWTHPVAPPPAWLVLLELGPLPSWNPPPPVAPPPAWLVLLELGPLPFLSCFPLLFSITKCCVSSAEPRISVGGNKQLWNAYNPGADPGGLEGGVQGGSKDRVQG